MSLITVDIPAETLLALKLFELGRWSSGAAARLAGVPRLVFLAKLVDYGVDTFRRTEDKLRGESRLA